MNILIHLQPDWTELPSGEDTIASCPLDTSSLDWLKVVVSLTGKHHGEKRFTIEFLASGLNISSRQLQRRFRRLTGLTVNRYIQEVRLQRGKKLLECGLLLKQVAAEVGFRDANYFAQLYYKRFGVRVFDHGESGSPPLRYTVLVPIVRSMSRFSG